MAAELIEHATVIVRRMSTYSGKLMRARERERERKSKKLATPNLRFFLQHYAYFVHIQVLIDHSSHTCFAS